MKILGTDEDVAGWSVADPEQRKKDEKKYGKPPLGHLLNPITVYISCHDGQAGQIMRDPDLRYYTHTFKDIDGKEWTTKHYDGRYSTDICGIQRLIDNRYIRLVLQEEKEY